MTVFKACILTAGIIGIISTIIGFAAPEGSLRQQLKTIMTMVLVLALFAPFIGKGFSLSDYDSYSLESTEEYSDYTQSFEEYYTAQAEENVKEQLEADLTEKGISFKSISITCELDEYNSIVIKKAEITLPTDSRQADEAKQAAETMLSGTEITITED